MDHEHGLVDFRGVHVYSPTKFSFDNTIYDETYDFKIRSREIARLKISGKSPKIKKVRKSPVLAKDAKVEKVIGGFQFIDAATVDKAGAVYFSDSRWHRIYRWSPEKEKLSLILDVPISPLGLSIDEKAI